MGYREEMRGGESATTVGGPNYEQQLKRSLSGDYLPKCNENHDIRKDGIKEDPFCHSANKEFEREMRPVLHDKTGSNENLHADTTLPDDNKISGNYDAPLCDSAEGEKARELKNTDNRKAVKGRSFNS